MVNVFRVLYLIFVFNAISAQACDCGNKGNRKQVYTFHGSIIDIKLDYFDLNEPKNESMDSFLIVKALVTNPLESDVKIDTVTLVTERGKCGIAFKIGETYYIQGYTIGAEKPLDSGFLYTDACTETKLLKQNKFEKIPDTQPVYINGGEKGMMKFIMKNVKMPGQIQRDCRVLVQFLVDTSGNVVQPVVTNSCGADFDAESVRIVKLLKFKPATQNGLPVKTILILPFLYKAE